LKAIVSKVSANNFECKRRYLLKLSGETVEESNGSTDGQIDVQIFFVSEQRFHAKNVTVMVKMTVSDILQFIESFQQQQQQQQMKMAYHEF
jgi:hypothetical protein